jgi:hypothetical protein
MQAQQERWLRAGSQSDCLNAAFNYAQKAENPPAVFLAVGSYYAGLRNRFYRLNHPAPEIACLPRKQQRQVAEVRVSCLFM